MTETVSLDNLRMWAAKFLANVDFGGATYVVRRGRVDGVPFGPSAPYTPHPDDLAVLCPCTPQLADDLIAGSSRRPPARYLLAADFRKDPDEAVECCVLLGAPVLLSLEPSGAGPHPGVVLPPALYAALCNPPEAAPR